MIIGVYTSVIPKEIKQEQLSKTIILSTTKSAGAALDIRDLKATIILAEPFKSEILAKQTLGRTRNPNTECIEVVDDGFRSISRFYNAKKLSLVSMLLNVERLKLVSILYKRKLMTYLRLENLLRSNMMLDIQS